MTPTAHWPEYAIEAGALGYFMVSACVFTVLLVHPQSPIVAALPSAMGRQVLIGLAMGATAVSIFYSGWGRRSGAHINPAVTLTFARLGRVAPHDALFYAAAQFVGAIVGTSIAALLLGMWVRHAAVDFAATRPGPGGTGIAFAAETAISFVMMSMVLRVSASRWARWTGLCAGALVALYIIVEAPLSGMSMNPARSFASALLAGQFADLWIYFTAPPLGMLLAAEAYVRFDGAGRDGCAKLRHVDTEPCLFCDFRARRSRADESAPESFGR